MTILFSCDQASKSYGLTTALAPLSLTVETGRSLGIIGESGSGKTTLVRLLLGLTAPSSGTVLYRDQPVEVLQRGGSVLRKEVTVVFQDPFSSLNPRMTVGQIIAEPLRIHKAPADCTKTVKQVLLEVGLDPTWSTRKPHQLSGGQRQRVAIARAIAPNPRVIIADEPVSALDVSVRVTILDLFQQLQQSREVTLIVVSHDLGIVQYLCDDTLVLARGHCVEYGTTEALLTQPRHSVTQSLISAVPELPL